MTSWVGIEKGLLNGIDSDEIIHKMVYKSSVKKTIIVLKLKKY